MSLDPNKTYIVWNGNAFPNSTSAKFKAPAGSTIDWGDGTAETFDTASTTVNTHTYTDGKTEHTIAISGLTSIGDSAFRGCSSLTSVTISNSVTSINYAAFNGCSSLTSATIGNGVTSIGPAAFSWCSRLTSVTIPNSITSISWDAFNNCSSLTSITIPNSVTSIDSAAFKDCSSLKQLILFPSTPPTLGSNVIPSNVQSIYVQQSSKAAYQAATNWTTFASKIVSDNIYLSFVRFNQKNKEYISKKVDEKVDNKLTAPTTPTANSVVIMEANGTTGTKALSEFGGKLYAHEMNINLKDEKSNSVNIRSLIYSSINTAANNSATLVGLLNGQRFPAWGYATNSNYYNSYFIQSLYAENRYFRYTYISPNSNTEFSGGDIAEAQCTEITITDTVTEL